MPREIYTPTPKDREPIPWPHIFVAEDGPGVAFYEAFGFKRLGIPLLTKQGLTLMYPDSFAEAIQDPPVPHENSEALYYLDGHRTNNDDTVLYLSVIPEDGVTSTHHHPNGVREHYRILYGAVQINGAAISERVKTIEPGEKHHAQAQDGPALLLIVTTGARNIPNERLHLYEEQDPPRIPRPVGI